METILVVEDDKDVLNLIRLVLQEVGYHVITALSGEHALMVSEEHGQPIDLLLADVVLTGMPGHELADHLYTSNPAMRVIFITGYAIDKIAAEIATVPNDLLLTKPVSIGQLISKIRMVLRDSASTGSVPK